MRIIITGGSGLLGRILTDKLTAEGHELLILSRNPAQVRGLPTGAKAIGWDGRTAAGWGDLITAETAIINFAGANIGEGRWTAARKKEILESRVLAGQAVVAAVASAAHKPTVVIQSSAVGYYGNRGDELLGETAAPGQDFTAEVCVAWEQAAEPLTAHTRLVTIRTGVVLTTEGGALAKMLTPFKLFAGGPFGSGKQWFPWIHLEDEIGAIWHLLHHPSAQGTFNLTAPGVLRNGEFAKMLGKVMNRPAIAAVPSFALRLALGEMADLVLHGQRATADKLLASGYQFQFPQAEAALQHLLTTGS